jgi:hypothetical protein
MEKNIGKTDKIIRAILAMVFVYLAYKYSWWLLIVSIFLVYTIATGSCLPYKLLGISTAKK